MCSRDQRLAKATMNRSTPIPSPFAISDRITCLPVVHGSGNCALAVRKWLLDNPCDCLAVELPHSFRASVVAAVEKLPTPSLILQKCLATYRSTWTPDVEPQDDSAGRDESEGDAWSYVPIDPCQSVIMAIRIALGEHWPIEFCDLETNAFQPVATVMPDAYALKTVPLERFATAILPSITRPFQEQTQERIEYMAWKLRQLEKVHERIVIVCSILQWPWLREAYLKGGDEPPSHDSVEAPEAYSLNPNSLIFLFGELPYITGLYERARAQLEDDENLAIDGVKQLLISARGSYIQDLGKRARKITPLLLKQCLKYIRNLTVLEHRMTPDLYTMAVAAQQILGDQYAIHLIETARNYPFHEELGISQITL